MAKDLYKRLCDPQILKIAANYVHDDKKDDFIPDTFRNQDYIFNLEENLERLAQALKNGTYRPRPLKEIDVPKIPAELPVVLINSTSPADHPSVLPAEYEAGRAMATMLLEAGHRDIAVIGYSPEHASNPRESVTIQLRYDGIFAALNEYGVTPSWLYDSFVW